EAVGEFGQGVTDDGAVGCGDGAVAGEVGIAGVAGSDGLFGAALLDFVGRLPDALVFIAEERADGLADLQDGGYLAAAGIETGADVTGVLVADGAEAQDLVDVPGEVEGGSPPELAGFDVDALDGKLEALVANGADVLEHAGKTRRLRKGDVVEQL